MSGVALPLLLSDILVECRRNDVVENTVFVVAVGSNEYCVFYCFRCLPMAATEIVSSAIFVAHALGHMSECRLRCSLRQRRPVISPHKLFQARTATAATRLLSLAAKEYTYNHLGGHKCSQSVIFGE